MLPSRVRRQCLVALLVLAGVGCDSGSSGLPTQPDPPEMVTETFTGTVGQNGAVTFNFTTASAGQVTARVSVLSSGMDIPMGLSLGEWNSFACEIKISNDSAVLGTAIAGNVSGAGILCVRFHDAGKIPDPNPDPVRVTFELVVVHP
jgi:hypothetical protein